MVCYRTNKDISAGYVCVRPHPPAAQSDDRRHDHIVDYFVRNSEEDDLPWALSLLHVASDNASTICGTS